MKLTVFTLLFINLAMAQAPTAEMIRKSISDDNKSLNIGPEKIFKVEERVILEGLKVRIYKPSDKSNLPIIYNIHGGALVAGDLETHENVSRVLANKTNSIVVAIDYRKPPENPFPAGIQDVYQTLLWIFSNSSTIGGNPTKVSMLSDSGGSLLAAAAQIKLLQANLPQKITKAVYINPAVDLRNPGEGFYQLVTSMYLAGSAADNEMASPILYKDFSKFPTSLIVVSEKDVLKQHGIELDKKLRESGVASELIEIPNEDHLGNIWAVAHPKVLSLIEKIAAFLNK